jgi:hypothetical protein
MANTDECDICSVNPSLSVFVCGHGLGIGNFTESPQ